MHIDKCTPRPLLGGDKAMCKIKAKNSIAFTFIFLCLSNASLSEANWMLYADQDGGQGFYESASIKKVSDSTYNVLTYINIPESSLVYKAEDGTKVNYSMKVMQQYDCKAHLFRYIGYIEYFMYYDLKGPLLHKKKNDAGAKLIEKGAPAESLERLLCNTKGRSLIGL
jgi:hypothetical protein